MCLFSASTKEAWNGVSPPGEQEMALLGVAIHSTPASQELEVALLGVASYASNE